MPENFDKSQLSKGINYGFAENEVHDDKMGESNITYMRGNANTVFQSVPLDSQQTRSQEKFERLYRSVFVAIERRPEDSQVAKSELLYITKKIYDVVLEGETADYPTIRRLLKQLYALAPDVFQICVTILTNPYSELPLELMAVVQEVKDGCEPSSQINMPLSSYLERELTAHQLPPDESNRIRAELTRLQTAVDSGNVQPIRQLLVDLTSALPGMRQPLRSWLVDSSDVPTAIRVFARNYL